MDVVNKVATHRGGTLVVAGAPRVVAMPSRRLAGGVCAAAALLAALLAAGGAPAAGAAGGRRVVPLDALELEDEGRASGLLWFLQKPKGRTTARGLLQVYGLGPDTGRPGEEGPGFPSTGDRDDGLPSKGEENLPSVEVGGGKDKDKDKDKNKDKDKDKDKKNNNK